MMDLTAFLKELMSLPGLSAYEDPVRELIKQRWEPFVDATYVSKLGSLHALRRGKAAEPRKRILLAGHMDAIGLMVTGIKDGFIRFTEIGGVDYRILPGQRVVIYGREVLPGVIIQPSPRLLPPDLADKPVPMARLWIDTGLEPSEVNQKVRVGDIIMFAQAPIELGNKALSGHSLDDRAAIAAISVCLEELQHVSHAWDVWAVATVQEEETLGGAMTSPFEIQPNLAIAVDVTFAKGPGVSEYPGFAWDKGPTLGWGPNIHPALHKAFKELAEKLDIPCQVEVMPRHSGTDAIAMQVTAEGIPCLVVGIPLRYMHTPVETVILKDIERTGHLLAQFIAHLDPEYMPKFDWEEDNEHK